MLQRTYSEVTVYSNHQKAGTVGLAVGMGSNTGHINTQDIVCVSHLQMFRPCSLPRQEN